MNRAFGSVAPSATPSPRAAFSRHPAALRSTRSPRNARVVSLALFPAVVAVLVGALSTGLGGCGQAASPAPEQQAPRITRFEATPARVRPGALVTVRWETEHARTVSLKDAHQGELREAGNQPAGVLQVRVAADTVFTLEARSEAGLTGSAAATVQVEGEAPAEPLFTATPRTVDAGAAAQLAWMAEGAQVVTLAPLGGAPLPLGGLQRSGTIVVRPERSTTYILTVDGRALEQTVFVRPRILQFESERTSVEPGASFDVSWRTAGATRLELRSPEGAVLQSFADGPAVSEGRFRLTLPATASVSSFASYVLVAFGGEGGRSEASRALSLPVAGRPRITSLHVPRYVPLGEEAQVRWTSKDSEQVQLFMDEVLVYTSADFASAREGVHRFEAPENPVTFRLVVTDGRGGRDEQTAVLEGIGELNVVSFTSSAADAPIANGGDPVTLSWEVQNARGLRITDVGGRVVVEREGPEAEKGSVTVFPNRASVEYALWATNQAGDTLGEPDPATAPRVRIQVTTVLSPPVPPRPVPPGALVPVPHPVPGAPNGRVLGVPHAVRNAPEAAFIDISDSGLPLSFSNPDFGYLAVPLDRELRVVQYGSVLTTRSLVVSLNGWMALNPGASAGPAENQTLPNASLPRSAVVPLWSNLLLHSDSRVLWKDEGASPHRRVIVQWMNMRLKGRPDSRLTFQAQVDERGTIVFAYERLDGLLDARPPPTVGIQNERQNAALELPQMPEAGETWTLFGPVTAPAPIPAFDQPYVYLAELPSGGLVDVAVKGVQLPRDVLHISELHMAPAPGVVDGEWLEVQSRWRDPIPLDGWTLSINGVSHTLEGPLTVPPFGRVVLAQSADAGDGVAVHATYPNTLSLPDGGGVVALSYGGKTYLSRTYEVRTGTQPVGVSLQLDPEDRGDVLVYSTGVRSHCNAIASYGTHGQRGTPGSPNTSCLPYVTAPIDLSTPGAQGFRSIASTGTVILQGGPNGEGSDDVLVPLELPFDVRYGPLLFRSVRVSTNGWLSGTEATDSAPWNSRAPNVAQPNGSIAPFWDNLVFNDSPNAGIYWQAEDPDGEPATGDEAVLISWEGASLAHISGISNLNFQVRLTASGTVEFHYGGMDATNRPERARGSSATIWLEEAYGDSALRVGADQPIVDPNTSRRFTLFP